MISSVINSVLRRSLVFLSMMLVFSMSGCGGAGESPGETAGEEPTADVPQEPDVKGEDQSGDEVFQYYEEGPVDQEMLATLEENRQKWEDMNLESYQVTLTKSCFCFVHLQGNLHMTVHDGSIVEAYSGTTGVYLTEEEFGALLTIEEAFDYIELHLGYKHTSFVVNYDSYYGYPTEILIDKELLASDAGILFYFSDLQ